MNMIRLATKETARASSASGGACDSSSSVSAGLLVFGSTGNAETLTFKTEAIKADTQAF
jgi:hypothetical protein